MELNNGQMDHIMRDTFMKVENMVKELINGTKDVHMLDNGRTIKLMVLENTIGQMEGYLDR